MSNVYYVSVHSDPKVYTNQYKKVIAKHSLYIQPKQGRKSGKTCAANAIINKLSEALMDCGAVPLKDLNVRSRLSVRPATFFVTQLEAYWEEAIVDLAKVGVRIYVLPVEAPADGLPDPVLDSFNSYYKEKFNKYLELAKKGTDIRHLVEVAVSLSEMFDCADIRLNAAHRKTIDEIYAIFGDKPLPVVEKESVPIETEDDFVDDEEEKTIPTIVIQDDF